MRSRGISSRGLPGLGAVLLLAGWAVTGLRPAAACTTVLVGRSLTADGSVIHAHNEDMGNDTVGRLWVVAPARHGAGSKLAVPYVELAQAPATLGYWASGNAQGAAGLGIARPGGTEAVRPYDSVLVGLNERGVSMSCNWAHSREENREGKGIRRYAIRQLLLERATSARHGVEILGELIETHGQADWGGLIYHLADGREAWVVETTTRNWVARRVRDDEIRVTANRFRIGSDYDLSSKALVDDAIDNGWLAAAEEELDFSQTYGRPGKMDQPYDSRREERVVQLLESEAGRIEPSDLVVILRDRYEGTEHYTPPQPGPVWREDLDEKAKLSRTISTNLAQSTFVAHQRSNLPVSVGSVMWFGFGTPSYTAYVPLYAGADSVPQAYSEPAVSRSADSAWWLFRRLQRAADPRYPEVYPLIRAKWDTLFAEASKSAQEVEHEALALLSRGETNAAGRLLSAFGFERGQKALDEARGVLRAIVSPDSR